MMSQMIISLRQGSRSTQAPAGRPMISQGRQAGAVSGTYRTAGYGAGGAAAGGAATSS